MNTKLKINVILASLFIVGCIGLYGCLCAIQLHGIKAETAKFMITLGDPIDDYVKERNLTDYYFYYSIFNMCLIFGSLMSAVYFNDIKKSKDDKLD